MTEESVEIVQYLGANTSNMKTMKYGAVIFTGSLRNILDQSVSVHSGSNTADRGGYKIHTYVNAYLFKYFKYAKE